MEMESEKHSIWRIWDHYKSPRIGLHLYESKKGLRGYYENGSRDKYGSLRDRKTWFRLTIKPNEGGSVVTCKLMYNPYIMMLFSVWLFLILEAIYLKNWSEIPGLLFILIIMFVFVNQAFNDVDAILNTVKDRLGGT